MALQPNRKMDEWTRHKFELYSSAEVQTRIRAKAAKLAAENRRLRNAGAHVPLLEVEDFILHVWTIALRKRPDLPDGISMILYFWRRMENYYKDKCKKAAGAKFRVLSTDAPAMESPATRELDIISIAEHRRDEVEREKRSALRSFRAYLPLQEPKLIALLDLITIAHVDNAREQALRLEVEVAEVFRLRARLQQMATRFGDTMKSKN